MAFVISNEVRNLIEINDEISRQEPRNGDMWLCVPISKNKSCLMAIFN